MNRPESQAKSPSALGLPELPQRRRWVLARVRVLKRSVVQALPCGLFRYAVGDRGEIVISWFA